MRLRSFIFALLAAIYLVNCASKPVEVGKRIENGIEVVFNKLKPYTLEGEPSTLNLEIEFTIDTENDEIAALGVTDIQGIDVDSEESIYIFKPALSQGDLIYIFSRDGEFIRSFLHKGQGLHL